MHVPVDSHSGDCLLSHAFMLVLTTKTKPNIKVRHTPGNVNVSQHKISVKKLKHGFVNLLTERIYCYNSAAPQGSWQLVKHDYATITSRLQITFIESILDRNSQWIMCHQSQVPCPYLVRKKQLQAIISDKSITFGLIFQQYLNIKQ